MSTKKGRNLKPNSNWKELAEGGIIPEYGNADCYETGDWRSYRPVWVEEKCIHCMQCWRFCPDSSIIPEDGKFKEFDYHHCKGCGICVNVCPTKAIDFIAESEIDDKEAKEKEKI